MGQKWFDKKKKESKGGMFLVPSADINLFFSNKNAILLLKFGTLPEEEKIQKKFSL